MMVIIGAMSFQHCDPDLHPAFTRLHVEHSKMSVGDIEKLPSFCISYSEIKSAHFRHDPIYAISGVSSYTRNGVSEDVSEMKWFVRQFGAVAHRLSHWGTRGSAPAAYYRFYFLDDETAMAVRMQV
jgi:hypothetical protein